MSAPSNADLPTLDLDLPLRPYELMAAWRTASRTLVVVVHAPVHVEQRVQARITVLGLGASATILGRAARVDPSAIGVELELAPDELRVRTLEALVEVAGGARAEYRTRAPRFLAQVPAVVYRQRHAMRMTTFAVSENGCGLAWSGPMPAVGTPLEIHLGSGTQVASFCGEVRWTAPPDRPPTLGLRFEAGDRATWARILAEVQRAGAPPA